MILALALALAAAAPTADRGCYRPAEGEIVAQRMILRGRAATYEAVSVSRPRRPFLESLCFLVCILAGKACR